MRRDRPTIGPKFADAARRTDVLVRGRCGAHHVILVNTRHGVTRDAESPYRSLVPTDARGSAVWTSARRFASERERAGLGGGCAGLNALLEKPLPGTVAVSPV